MPYGALSWVMRVSVSHGDDEAIVEISSEFTVLDQNAPGRTGNAHVFNVPSTAYNISVEERIAKIGSAEEAAIGISTLEGSSSDYHSRRHHELLIYPRTKTFRGLSTLKLIVRFALQWTRPHHSSFEVSVDISIALTAYLESIAVPTNSEILNSLVVQIDAPQDCTWNLALNPKEIVKQGIIDCGCYLLPHNGDLRVDADEIFFSVRPNATGRTVDLASVTVNLPASQDPVELAKLMDRIKTEIERVDVETVVTFVCDLRGSTKNTVGSRPSIDLLRYHGIWRRQQASPFRLLKIVGDLVLAVCEPKEFLDAGLEEILRCYQESLDLGFPIRGGFHIGDAMRMGNNAPNVMAGSAIGEDYLGDAINHGSKIGDCKENDNGLIASQIWVDWMSRSGADTGATPWKDISIAGTSVKLSRVKTANLAKAARVRRPAPKALRFPDRLIARAKERGSKLVVGLDPDLDRFPAFLQSGWRQAASLTALEETIFQFNAAAIDAARPYAAAFKPQIAFYEQYGEAGYRALVRTIEYLHSRGELVILDAKRNDIQHTAKAYADAWLSEFMPFTGRENRQRVDAITINGYLGSEGILPFLSANPTAGIFVLGKTSNPSSSEFQDLELRSGKLVSQQMATLADEWGSRDGIGESGYSRIGLVVGATHPDACKDIRQLAPSAMFLMPGIGAQGGSPDAIAISAKPDGMGAYASSSRSVLYGFNSIEGAKSQWKDAVQMATSSEARELRDTINAGVKA